MFIIDLFVALVVGLIIVSIISRAFGTKGPWGSLLWFFSGGVPFRVGWWRVACSFWTHVLGNRLVAHYYYGILGLTDTHSGKSANSALAQGFERRSYL
jgi:uncharacterized membrane protein YczE